HHSSQPHGPARAQHEALQCFLVQSRDLLFQNHQTVLDNLPSFACGRVGPQNPTAQCEDHYLLASAGVFLCSFAAASLAAAAACFSALAASACRGSPNSSICCSATRVLCSS